MGEEGVRSGWGRVTGGSTRRRGAPRSFWRCRCDDPGRLTAKEMNIPLKHKHGSEWYTPPPPLTSPTTFPASPKPAVWLGCCSASLIEGLNGIFKGKFSPASDGYCHLAADNIQAFLFISPLWGGRKWITGLSRRSAGAITAAGRARGARGEGRGRETLIS